MIRKIFKANKTFSFYQRFLENKGKVRIDPSMEYNYRCHQSRQGWILWEQPRKVWNLSQHYKLDAFSFNHTSSICYPETKTINFQKIIISMSIFLLSKSHVLFAGECTTIFCKKIASEWNGSSSINRASVQPGLEEVLFFYLLSI